VNVQEKRASAMFPFEALASALPDAGTVSVPPVFAQIPVKPA